MILQIIAAISATVSTQRVLNRITLCSLESPVSLNEVHKKVPKKSPLSKIQHISTVISIYIIQIQLLISEGNRKEKLQICY